MLFALVEESTSVAHLIGRMLKTQGHRVTHFSDGASFLASVQTIPYDFVLIDINLPGTVSCLQVISFLRENMPGMPMLVITGVHKLVLQNAQTKYPQLLVLYKPFHIQELLQSIEIVQRSPIPIAFGELVNDEFLYAHAGRQTDGRSKGETLVPSRAGSGESLYMQ